jgi:hypothetical protein
MELLAVQIFPNITLFVNRYRKFRSPQLRLERATFTAVDGGASGQCSAAERILNNDCQ